MRKYRSGSCDMEVAAFIREVLEDGARLSNEIHELCGRQFGENYKDDLAGPREILSEDIETGLGGGQGSGRARYWALHGDVDLVGRGGGRTRRVRRYAAPKRMSH